MSRLSIARREALTDLWLAGPATLAMVVFIFVPVAIVAFLSFSDYQFGAPSLNWVGLENYAKLFGSTLGRRAITNTLIYVAIVIPASVGLGLLVALGLHRMTGWALQHGSVPGRARRHSAGAL
jgi:multiple sugar transport system permease protein